MRQPISERPILDVPRTGLELLLDVAGVLALLGSYLTIALAWSKFPDRIPTHFNAAGEVNGWGPRETLWIAPGVMTLVFVVLTIAARFPQRFNYPWPITAENAERQYRMARTLLAAVRLAVAFTCFFAVSAIPGRARVRACPRGDLLRRGVSGSLSPARAVPPTEPATPAALRSRYPRCPRLARRR
jgi:hypothetical protein